MEIPTNDILAAMHPCQRSSLQPPPPHGARPVLCRTLMASCSPACAWVQRLQPCGPLSPEPTFRAAASQAGQAGCRAGPVCGGSAAAGGGSSSRGSAVECGAAGKCAASEPQAPAQDLASEGRGSAAEPAAVATGADEPMCWPGGM